MKTRQLLTALLLVASPSLMADDSGVIEAGHPNQNSTSVESGMPLAPSRQTNGVNDRDAPVSPERVGLLLEPTQDVTSNLESILEKHLTLELGPSGASHRGYASAY